MKSISQKAAIFDMDGVLIVNMHFHELAFYEFGKRHHVEITRDFFLHHITGSTNERIMPRIFGDLSDQDIQVFSEEKEAIYRELYAPEMKATDGLFEFLDYLQEKQVKMVIASNAPMENIHFVMEALGLGHYFKVVLNGSMVPHPKPAPDMFLLGAELVGARPQDSVVFEDAIGGIRAANAAGMKAVGLDTTHTAQELGKTDLVISDFKTSQLYDFWERTMVN